MPQRRHLVVAISHRTFLTPLRPELCRRRDVPSVSLEMQDEEDVKGSKEAEDVNTHHLLQQHLYKGRKQVGGDI